MQFNNLLNSLQTNPRRWLITGVAGFIGSNLARFLLKNNQIVIGIDNLSAGLQSNIDAIKENDNFFFVKDDLVSFATCQSICQNVDYILHHAALSSVPSSIDNPIATHAANLTGFINLLVAARDAKVKNFVYASSSAIYGNEPTLPKCEDKIGEALSPYTVTKYANELYAANFAHVYGFRSVGLRYFNVFGPGQDPNGAYAAVIPRWIDSMLQYDNIYINGDGATTRDFCYIDNVVQANILAATSNLTNQHEVFNIAYGTKTSLQELYVLIKNSLSKYGVEYNKNPIYRNSRVGDIKHSVADIAKAQKYLGYAPQVDVKSGIEKTLAELTKNFEFKAKFVFDEEVY